MPWGIGHQMLILTITDIEVDFYAGISREIGDFSLDLENHLLFI